MHRARFAFAAPLVATALFAGPALAGQTPQPPPMQSVLAGKKFTPPLKGLAQVEFTNPVTRREKDMVVTRIVVKNISNGPIGRLAISETWYDKAGAIVGGSKGTINGLLQPGEVKTIIIETPYNSNMSSNNYNFTHANGTVKPTKVAKLEVPKDAAPAAPAKK